MKPSAAFSYFDNYKIEREAPWQFSFYCNDVLLGVIQGEISDEGEGDWWAIREGETDYTICTRISHAVEHILPEVDPAMHPMRHSPYRKEDPSMVELMETIISKIQRRGMLVDTLVALEQKYTDRQV